MSKEAKRFNTAVKKQTGSTFDVPTSANSDRFNDFRYALENKVWLRSEPVEFEGEMVDMAQFEFMMACLNLGNVNRYDLQRFYASLWPYIEKIVLSYESLDNAFNTLEQDQIEVLNKYAKQNMELKLYKNFFKTLPNDIRTHFHHIRDQHNEDMEAKIKEAQEREKEFMNNYEDKKAKKALERKFRV